MITELTDEQLKSMSDKDVSDWVKINLRNVSNAEWDRVYHGMANRWAHVHGIKFYPASGHRGGWRGCASNQTCGYFGLFQLCGPSGKLRLFKTMEAAQKACDKFNA